jgi:hypothetical protein
MGKRGRLATEDQELLNGLVDGEFHNQGYTRTIKGVNRIDVTEDKYETTVVRYKKDESCPATVNGGWKMVSMEIIPKTEQKFEEEAPGKFDEPLNNSSLPKTKRKYFNKANQKWVGYTRALALGLIK